MFTPSQQLFHGIYKHLAHFAIHLAGCEIRSGKLYVVEIVRIVFVELRSPLVYTVNVDIRDCKPTASDHFLYVVHRIAEKLLLLDTEFICYRCRNLLESEG